MTDLIQEKHIKVFKEYKKIKEELGIPEESLINIERMKSNLKKKR